MHIVTVWLSLLVLAPPAEAIGPGHAENPVCRRLREEGIRLGEATVTFPLPTLRDGMTAEAQREAVRTLAGGDRALADLLRGSVTAPQILKVRDLPAGTGGLVREADLWFVVHADFDALDPAELAINPEDRGPIEVGNMRFEGREVPDDILKARRIERAEGREWYGHVEARLLDRLHVEATTRTFATRSDESLSIGSVTDRSFDGVEAFPNRWWPLDRRGGKEFPGEARPYEGGAGVVTVHRLAFATGALLVEAHFAFLEPKGWFDGAPILRSKISLVAQDRVRALRREIAKREDSR